MKIFSHSLALAEAFPEYGVNPLGAALRGARSREGLTQRQLAEELQMNDYRVFL
jgi:ribosome-binding protein aMBF1 (putative translation factor)